MEKGREFTLPSGAKMLVSVASYADVIALHDALGAELRGRGLGTLDVAKIKKTFEVAGKKREAAAIGAQFIETTEGDEGLNVIVDKLLGVISSKEVKDALFACAEHAVYMPTGDMESAIQFCVGAPGYGVFDNPKCMTQAREDFYEICRAIGEENLRPFGKALFSLFTALVGSSADIQGSNTAKA